MKQIKSVIFGLNFFSFIKYLPTPELVNAFLPEIINYAAKISTLVKLAQKLNKIAKFIEKSL